jgi:hypothetical protein
VQVLEIVDLDHPDANFFYVSLCRALGLNHSIVRPETFSMFQAGEVVVDVSLVVAAVAALEEVIKSPFNASRHEDVLHRQQCLSVIDTAGL